MNTGRKVLVVIALAVAIGAVVALKQSRRPEAEAPVTVQEPAVAETAHNFPAPTAIASTENQPLPRLVDVGAGTCIPCKMMMPVLAELKAEYAGRLKVEYYDIRDDPNAVTRYNISVIPTQIFFDAKGNELYRHMAFFAKEDIVAKWKELGVDLLRGGP